ncbi:MAG: PHP domain-containing protein [Patescibacteria group bacterium]|jgi:hypothetical protein
MLHTVDLHTHSDCSDGALSVPDLMARAHESGVTTLAISDHDTLEQVRPSLLLGQTMGIRVISAVEISATMGCLDDYHILGYRIDPDNSALRDRLEQVRQSRIKRFGTILGILQDLGFVVDTPKICSRRRQSPGKPHIAKAILGRSENAERLRREGIANTGQFIDAYLNEGKPAYVIREKLSLSEAIELIHGASGLAILAHPGWTYRNFDWNCGVELRHMKSLGIDGVEVFYTSHSEGLTLNLHAQAQKLGLIETAGSDFHSPDEIALGVLGAWNDYGLEPDFSPVTG